ncbi:Hypothetical protein, putative [Bodo saltans]|uniref:Uncharacterized protein n=1 Tax=Bodo saltans TaxID=75058 RepID=A0A0S4JG20_BODSA|nr:Hypothetical protein, putative [Bodo saltans]|eukprot:CUG88975.1 Hypothetical protein, putative [Bodo saltans]
MSSPTVAETPDPATSFGVLGVPTYLNESLKGVVTSGLKELMHQHPENPIGFLADFVKRHGSAFKDDAFEVILGQPDNGSKKNLRSQVPPSPIVTPGTTNIDPSSSALIKVKMENLCQRQRRGASAAVYKRVSNVPLYGVETPNALELQRSLDAVNAAYPEASVINVIVEPPTVRESLVFCLGAPFISNLPEVLEQAYRRSAEKERDARAEAAATDAVTLNEFDATTLNAAAATATRRDSSLQFSTSGHVPSLSDATKQLFETLGHKRRPQTFPEIQQSLTSKAPLRYTYLPVEDNYEGTALHDVLDQTIGLDDDINLLVPALVVSFRRPRASMYHRILSLCAALLRPLEEVRVFKGIEKAIAETSTNAYTFMYHDFQIYWNKVLDARDRRDKQRIQKEADRKQAAHEARVAAAREAAAVAAAAAAANGGTEPEKLAPHPPQQDAAKYGSKHGSMRNLTQAQQQQQELIALHLPPLPPPSAQEVEARKRLVAARTNRRQQEDSEFIETMKITRHHCVCRIQRLFRKWRARARRALMEQELKASETSGAAVRPEVEAYRELMQEPPYVGPAFLRRAQHQLRSAHGELFSTLPPPPPVPARRKKHYAPQRSPIPAQYEDDVSSDDERWIEHITMIPDPSQLNRSVFFNSLARLKRCDTSAGNEMLNEALDIQSRFCGVGGLQRRAYRQMVFSSIDLLHIGYVELAHRKLLPSTGCTSFTQYIHKFHKDVLTWYASPHAVASSTSMTGDPVPLLHGPEHPLKDRLLYISLDTPAYLPWGNEEMDTTLSIRTSLTTGGPRYLTRTSRHLYFVPEYLDRGRWINAVQHLADDDKHEKIVWYSVSEDPYVYINGRAFVLAKRPTEQRVDGVLKHLTVEPTVVPTKQLTSPLVPVTSGAKLMSPTAVSSAALGNPALRSSISNPTAGGGPRFSRASAASQSPQDAGLTGVQDVSEPLSGAATKTYPQFGASITELENAVRIELHQAAVSNSGLISFCATPNIADIAARREAGAAAPHPPQPSSQNVSHPPSAQPSQYSIVIPALTTSVENAALQANVVAGQHHHHHQQQDSGSPNNNSGKDSTYDITIVAGGASTVFTAGAEPPESISPQAGSPVRLGSESFYEGYFTDSYSADAVVVRTWNINPKVEESTSRSNVGGVGGGVSAALGNRASNEGGAGSFQKGESSGVGGRSLRRKLGSKSNMETASQRRSMLDLNQRPSGSGDEKTGGGNTSGQHNGGGGAGGGGGAMSASFEPAPLVATPHQIAATVGAQDSINRFQFEMLRHSIQRCAGDDFLLPYSHFISSIFESATSGACIVIAMSDDASFFFGATAAIIDSAVRSAKAAMMPSGISVETSVDLNSPEDLGMPVAVAHHGVDAVVAHVTYALDLIPALRVLLRLIVAATESTKCTSLSSLTSVLDVAFFKCGIQAQMSQRLESLKRTAEGAKDRPIVREAIRELCQQIETFTWLVLLAVFLNEFAESIGGGVVVPKPSFETWLSSPRWKPVRDWMIDIDPWQEDEGAASSTTSSGVNVPISPDIHHTQYTNLYKRWTEVSYVSVAH